MEKNKVSVSKELLEFIFAVLGEVEEFCNSNPTTSFKDFKKLFDGIFEIYEKYVRVIEAGELPKDFLPIAIHLLKEFNSNSSLLLMVNRSSRTSEEREG